MFLLTCLSYSRGQWETIKRDNEGKMGSDKMAGRIGKSMFSDNRSRIKESLFSMFSCACKHYSHSKTS